MTKLKKMLLVVHSHRAAQSALEASAAFSDLKVRFTDMKVISEHSEVSVRVAKPNDIGIKGQYFYEVIVYPEVSRNLRDQYLRHQAPERSESMITPHAAPNPMIYVVSFAFDLREMHRPKVCLIAKKKPEWQAGHLNGVGGKIAPGETPVQAMRREFREETGVDMIEWMWHRFHIMRFANGAVVHCFTAVIPAEATPSTQEEEEIHMVAVSSHGQWRSAAPIIENLRWLIQMAFHELMVKPPERMLTHD